MLNPAVAFDLRQGSHVVTFVSGMKMWKYDSNGKVLYVLQLKSAPLMLDILILFIFFYFFSFPFMSRFLFQQVLRLMWQCVSCVSVPGKGCRSWGLWCQMCLFRCFWEVPTPLDTPTTLTMPSSSQSCAILHHNLLTVWMNFSNANLFTDGNPKELNVLIQITLTVMILFVLLRKHLRNQVGNSSTSAEECRR